MARRRDQSRCRGGPVDGTVDGQTASLSVRQGLTSATYGPVPNGIQSLIVIGHFTNCTTGFQALVADAGVPAFISNTGLVFGAGASTPLPDFDACSPWHVRVVDMGSTTDITVWQATSPEPDDPTISIASSNPTDRLTLKAVGVSGVGVSDRVEIDLLDVEPFPSG